MKSAIISRLKKNKQPVAIVDIRGNTYEGTVSGWDDELVALRLENGDDVVFPLTGITSLTISGGLDKWIGLPSGE